MPIDQYLSLYREVMKERSAKHVACLKTMTEAEKVEFRAKYHEAEERNAALAPKREFNAKWYSYLSTVAWLAGLALIMGVLARMVSKREHEAKLKKETAAHVRRFISV